MALFDVQDLHRRGFEGFVAVDRLDGPQPQELPVESGVYVVVRTATGPPAFLERRGSGWWKGKDPTVPLERLEREWVEGAQTLYIAKAKSLRERVGELLEFARGLPKRHYGGRLLWRVERCEHLLVACRLEPRFGPRRGMRRVRAGSGDAVLNAALAASHSIRGPEAPASRPCGSRLLRGTRRRWLSLLMELIDGSYELVSVGLCRDTNPLRAHNETPEAEHDQTSGSRRAEARDPLGEFAVGKAESQGRRPERGNCHGDTYGTPAKEIAPLAVVDVFGEQQPKSIAVLRESPKAC